MQNRLSKLPAYDILHTPPSLSSTSTSLPSHSANPLTLFLTLLVTLLGPPLTATLLNPTKSPISHLDPKILSTLSQSTSRARIARLCDGVKISTICKLR